MGHAWLERRAPCLGSLALPSPSFPQDVFAQDAGAIAVKRLFQMLRVDSPWAADGATERQTEAGQFLFNRCTRWDAWAGRLYASQLITSGPLRPPDPHLQATHKHLVRANPPCHPTHHPQSVCRERHWEVLEWALFLNARDEVTYRTTHGEAFLDTPTPDCW